MSQLDRKRYTYYGVMIFGATLIGLYFGYLWSVLASLDLVTFFLLSSGGIFVLVTILISYAKTRGTRLLLTAISGAIGGVHAYLDFVLFENSFGTILFMWFGLGLLLTYSTFSWLRE